MLLAGIESTILVIIACFLEYGISNIVLTGTIALYDCLNQVLRNIGIVCKELLGILWQAITTIAEAWVIVMGTDSWVETYAIDDCLGIESLYLCVCIQLIEVAYSECQIRIGEELDSLSFLHAHEESINVLLDGAFLEQRGEGLGCFLQHLDIGYRLDCLVLLCELWVLDNLWIAYDDAAWVKVIIECLALTKELWREEEVELLHALLGILQIEVAGVTYRDGALDDHHCIRVYLQNQVDDFFYMGCIEVVLHWVVVGWCCNHYEVCILIG